MLRSQPGAILRRDKRRRAVSHAGRAAAPSRTGQRRGGGSGTLCPQAPGEAARAGAPWEGAAVSSGG